MIERNRPQLYTDDSFFDSIDCPSKSYVLGFFAADGSVSKYGVVSFASKDFEHLFLIKETMSNRNKLTLSNDSCWRFAFSSKRIVCALHKLGFDNHKSYTAKLPVLDPILYSHFVRGLFDGDGCISRTISKKGKIPYPMMSICGTESILLSINKIIPVAGRIYRDKRKTMWVLKSTHAAAMSFFDWIYKDSNGLKLERKYSRYLDAKNRVGFYARGAHEVQSQAQRV